MSQYPHIPETLRDVVVAYLGARRSLIYEFSGDISREVRDLGEAAMRDLSPMMIAAGMEPLTLEEAGGPFYDEDDYPEPEGGWAEPELDDDEITLTKYEDLYGENHG